MPSCLGKDSYATTCHTHWEPGSMPHPGKVVAAALLTILGLCILTLVRSCLSPAPHMNAVCHWEDNSPITTAQLSREQESRAHIKQCNLQVWMDSSIQNSPSLYNLEERYKLHSQVHGGRAHAALGRRTPGREAMYTFCGGRGRGATQFSQILPTYPEVQAPDQSGGLRWTGSTTQRLCLLLFTCLLALAASLPAFDIKNLHLLNGTLDEILNVPPESSQLNNGGEHVRQVRDIAPHPPAGHGWPKDCSEIPASSRSGIYIIQPKGLHHLVVYCEMNVTGGGWTVIQRNQKDTPVTWAESWSTYKYGFGSVRSEYWLGTEYIHQISKQKVYQVRFVIQDSTDNTNFADYNLFSVEDESHGYRLRLGAYSGMAGDAMTSDNPKTMHDNMKFSTKDRDQDTYSKNCAYSYEGGWWYSACYSVRLNFKGGMTWGSLCKGNCKSSLILIKPATYC
ncbi:uncharacterized protein LOC141746170 [Larus michahellis]|uniref:uncharacterized protein LOC141737140 n=1 Tax=Larus michahellis TaxID=119627 RepID=UPI003D9BB36A